MSGRPVITDADTAADAVVLHVDDDASFLSLTEAYLSREAPEFDVRTETDPTAVLDALDGVDCVVSDYDMPQMDGLTLLRQVREVNGTIPFVLFTAQGSEEIAAKAISAGVTDYIQKSPDPQQFAILANRIRNLADHYRSQRRIDRQQRRFRKLVEHSSDVVSVVDVEGRFTYLSPSARHVFGYAPEELVGDVGFDYLHPDDTEYAMTEFLAALDDPTYRPVIEFRFRHPDGWRVLENRGRNLVDDPDVEGFLINSHDVTERKRRERELRRQRDRLEEFASMVSHDLRNPLGVADGNLELFRQTGDRSFARRAQHALDRMAAIIDDLLTLAREGESIDTPVPVRLSAIVEAAWETVDTADAVLDDGSSLVVVADPSRLQQLLENLFRNAVEHASTADDVGDADAPLDDSRPLRVRVGPLVDGGADGPYCGFYVEDDGPGIDPTIRDQVFEYGFTTADGGTGLGLAIVSQIVAAHGWTIAVTDAPSGGARFEITDAVTVTSEETGASDRASDDLDGLASAVEGAEAPTVPADAVDSTPADEDG